MIRVFTDSAANLSPTVLGQCELHCLPLRYTVNGEEPQGAFNAVSFYEAMRQGAEVKTSMVSPGVAEEAFTPYLAQGDDVVCLCLSSGISSSYQTLCMVARELEAAYSGRRVRILDTRGASLGEGLPAVEAAELALAGVPLEALCERIERQISRMNQYFVVDHLKYLRKTGRLWGGAALAGQLLQIKPILFGDEQGHIVVREKTRGKRKAVERLAELYAQKRTDSAEALGIAQADCPADALHLQHLLRRAGHTGPIHIVGYEPVTGSHVGPGTLALFFYGDKR